uniref:Uncharacterized protein n=1 Tax=uncultured alpha proteobacterium HF0130_06E21 TaxID=710808 RepID=E0XT09_9PROT|nr:hypothetical protein [uncultured alpha proteobacterium HF0130_06E21]
MMGIFSRIIILIHVLLCVASSAIILVTLLFYEKLNSGYHDYIHALGISIKGVAIGNIGFAIFLIVLGACMRWILQGRWIWIPVVQK